MGKKLIALTAVIVLGLSAVVLGGCAPPQFKTDRVIVSIAAEYREQYLAKEITVEDFKWKNVDRLEYGTWYDSLSAGKMIVFLKKHGKQQVLKAVDHIRTLSFIRTASISGYVEML